MDDSIGLCRHIIHNSKEQQSKIFKIKVKNCFVYSYLMFDLFGVMLGHLYIAARRFLSTTCILYESFKPIGCLINGINAMEIVYMHG